MGKGEAIPNYTKVQSGVADSTIFMIFFFFPRDFLLLSLFPWFVKNFMFHTMFCSLLWVYDHHGKIISYNVIKKMT